MDQNKNSGPVTERANRYELRSKHKEDPEPKLKDAKKEVKEVAASTQGRKKRAVLSTSTVAGTSDGVSVPDGSGDLDSTEMAFAFSIDHIREQIFCFLPNEDLYNCRQVCHSWNSYASLELQKRIDSLFLGIGTKECSQFLGLLDKRPVSMMGLSLPYSKFCFVNETYSASFLKNRAMLRFLNKYGPCIRELSFVSEHCYKSLPEEKEVIDFVTNLLIHQTPNLSKLKIMLKCSVSWVEGGPTRKWNSTLLATDPEFKEIHSKTWGTNSKLKVFSLTEVSAKLLEVVIQLAPNLREINAKGWDSNKNDYKYFLEPLNRLGHLKQIWFKRNSTKNLEILENVCELTHRGDASLKLRAISFVSGEGMNFYVWSSPPFFGSHDMRVRSENVINHLLECSWNSLETIKWDQSTGLLGLKWPEVLPNVQKLIISSTLGDHVSPNGFPWSTTFPKLRSVYLNDEINEPDFTNAMDLLFQQQKVESVKYVHVQAGPDWTRPIMIAAHFRRLQSIFPNAKIDTPALIIHGPRSKLEKLREY